MVTEATLRILPRAPASRTLLIAFDTVRAAGETVAAIIAAGIIPAALEFMDRRLHRRGRGVLRAGLSAGRRSDPDRRSRRHGDGSRV